MQIEEVRLKGLADQNGNYENKTKVRVVEGTKGELVAQFNDAKENVIFIRMDELKKFVKVIEAIE